MSKESRAQARNPFTAEPDDLSVGTGKQELIDLQCDESAQEKFKDFTLAFWSNVSFSYSTLEKNANSQLSKNIMLPISFDNYFTNFSEIHK